MIDERDIERGFDCSYPPPFRLQIKILNDSSKLNVFVTVRNVRSIQSNAETGFSQP
jgi:hypothetical protein